MNPRRSVLALLLSATLFSVATVALAAPALVTSRASLAGNTSITWGGLGGPFTGVSSPFAISASPCVVNANVANSTDFIPPDIGFRRVNEGSVIFTGWRGNFAVGNNLLFTTLDSVGPINIAFTTPVMGAGAQIQSTGLGTFRATIKAYDALDNQIASFTVAGSSTIAQNNSAIFVGVKDTTASISRITFSVEYRVFILFVGFQYFPWSFAINQVDLLTAPTVNAGSNAAVCAGHSVQLAGTAANYSSVAWSGGSGSFTNGTTLNATYTPSAGETGTVVTLYLTAYCGTASTTGSVYITVNPPPSCAITLDTDAADGVVLPATSHTASVPAATPTATYQWVVTDGVNNLITSSTPYGNSIQWQAPADSAHITISVTVTDGNGCTCTADPPVDIDSIEPIPLASWIGLALLCVLIAGCAVARLLRA
jgi:hypothetical protein